MCKKILILNEEISFAKRDQEIFEELSYKTEYILFRRRNYQFIWFLKNPLEAYKKAKESDILFSWWATSFITVFLSKLTGTPSIIVAGGGEVETLKDLEKQYKSYSNSSIIGKLLIKFTLKFADKVISSGKYIKKNADKISKNTTNEVVYNVVDTNIFKKIDGITKKPYIITTAFMYKDRIKTKGLIPLLEAFNKIHKKYPEYKLIYLGDEPEGFKSARPNIKKRAKELGVSDKIIFMDFFKTKEEYINFLNQCKIYIQYSWHEGCPVAVTEAMACGIPVIGSNRTGVPDAIGDAGLIANGENPDNLAEKIGMLINDENLYNKLSKKGIERIMNNFSKEIRKQKLKIIIEQLKDD